MAREGAWRTMRSAEAAIAPNAPALKKPKIVSVMTLEGPDKVRMKSPGGKRGREELEEEMEVDEETEEDSLGPSSRDSSTSRRVTDPKGPKTKRKKRGRPAKNPENEGQFTAEKLRQRAKERDLEIIEEKEQEIANPEVKATSARAESVERNARKILDDLRELPYPELTERALRAIEAIKKVASSSRNMKGSFVGMLWKSSEELTAVSLACSSRMRNRGGEEGGAGEEEGETEKLRAKLSAIKTEQALILGENGRLRSQVEELRARVVLGEAVTPTPPHPTPPSPGPTRRRKGKGMGKGKKEIASDTTSLEENMEGVMMERGLSPDARERGIKARREVRADLEGGTLPPAVRPSLCGRSRVLDGGQREKESLAPPPPTEGPQRSSISEPSKGLTQEEIVRLIQSTVSQLLPQLRGREERAQQQQGPSIKDKASPPTPVEKSAGGGEGKKGGKKKIKRKGKKGKGGVVPSKGAKPPRVLTPSRLTQKGSHLPRDPLPFLV